MNTYLKLLMSCLFTLAFLLASSGIIPDANTLILGKILAQGIQQVKNLEDTYEKVRQTTELTLNTKNNIEELLDMQKQVQKLLLTARNISDFKFSDVSSLLKKQTGYQPDMQMFFSDNSAAKLLLDRISSQSTAPDLQRGASTGNSDGAKLYTLYHNPVNFPLDANGASKSMSDQIEIEKYLRAQHGASYQVLISFAERLEEQALEIESSVKKEDLFSMSTSERIELLLKAGTMMEKASELRMKASEVLQQPQTKTLSAVTKAAEYLSIEETLSARATQGRQLSEQLFSTK